MTEKTQIPSYPLRLDPDLRTRVEAAAKENKRSVNAELVARLEATISLEETLEHIAASVPLQEVGQMLIDLAQERSDAIDALHQMNIEVHAAELREQLTKTDERLDKIEAGISQMLDQLKKLQAK